MFEVVIALNTPLIKSVTKRGNETAFRIACVVPATFCAETPLKSLPADWATAYPGEREPGERRWPETAPLAACASLSARIRCRFSHSSRSSEAPAWHTRTIEAASFRRRARSIFLKFGDAVRMSRTRTRTRGRGSLNSFSSEGATLNAPVRSAALAVLQGEARRNPSRRSVDHRVPGRHQGAADVAEARRDLGQPSQQD